MSYFTLGILVDKQADVTQSRCFQHLARHPEQVGHKVFKQWLELEGKAAVKHRQKVLASGYQHAPGPALQQAGAKPQNAGNAAPRRDVTVTWPSRADSFSVEDIVRPKEVSSI